MIINRFIKLDNDDKRYIGTRKYREIRDKLQNDSSVWDVQHYSKDEQIDDHTILRETCEVYSSLSNDITIGYTECIHRA